MSISSEIVGGADRSTHPFEGCNAIVEPVISTEVFGILSQDVGTREEALKV